MKILPVNGIRNFAKINKARVLSNKNNIEKIQKSSYISNIYMGKDLIPFKSSAVQVNEEHFHLPEGCNPDEFQVKAAQALSEGKNVLVEAPTGTGKTAIAHYATSKNMEEGKTTFYTTPLKALSNQKLNEFKAVYGDENVGILTGDRRENPEAPVIIMTTEVYRNMALSNMYGDKNPMMENLGTVIFDEFHYLGDVDRGPVWEESLMYTPKGVQTLGLSATIGNPKELEHWIGTLDDNNVSLVSIPPEARHVPLKFDTIQTGAYRSEEKKMQKSLKRTGTYNADYDDQSLPPRPNLSDFKFVVNKLKSKEQLPAILFVFSRNFSRELLEYFSEEGDDLTTREEKKEIENIINKYKATKYIGADLDEDAIKKGYAIHNAGIMPQQKELIEELFQKKLVKTVIATETLAAGINMPAKTVVISYPYKPTDNPDEDMEGMRLISVNEFKQMSGRAGRRGIDEVGYVYTMPTSLAAENEFLMLESLDYDNINSKYNPDYAFLSGYYQHNEDKTQLKEIFEKSFYVHSDNEAEKAQKINDLMQNSTNKINVLKERGALIETENGFAPTLLGDMVSKVRGYDALTIAELIEEKKFENISPEALALTAAAIANPAKPNKAEIGVGDDLSNMFDDIPDAVDGLYDILKHRVNSIGKRLHISPIDFGGYQGMLEYAKTLEVPEGSADEVRMELERLSSIKSEIDAITKYSGRVPKEQVFAELKRGKTVSSRALQETLDEIQVFKRRNKIENFDDYVNELVTEIKSPSNAGKGNKAKAKQEKALQELQKQIDEARMMGYLDKVLEDKLADNQQYLRENSAKATKDKLNKIETLYLQMTAKDTLISALEGLIAIENYNQNNDIEEDCTEDFIRTSGMMNDVIEKSLDVRGTEQYYGIGEEADRYARSSAQNVYTWAMLNKVCADSVTNWAEMLKIVGENTDEGNIYREVMQSADLLSQIAEMSVVGEKGSASQEDREYYSNLKKTAIEARRLLIQEPATI